MGVRVGDDAHAVNINRKKLVRKRELLFKMNTDVNILMKLLNVSIVISLLPRLVPQDYTSHFSESFF